MYLSNNIYSAYKEQNVAELQKEEVNFHKLGELIGEYSIVIEYKVNIKQLFLYTVITSKVWHFVQGTIYRSFKKNNKSKNLGINLIKDVLGLYIKL